MDEAQLLGIFGNLVASFLWDAGKWLSKPLLDKLPDLATMLARGGEKQNHDLLRALRRAECRTVVALCDRTLREDCHFDPDSGWISRLSARWRAGQDLGIQDLVYLRRVFARRYEALASLPTAELLRLYGAAVTDAQALIEAGTECFAVADQDTLREQVVQRQIDALDRTVRTLPEATDAQALELRYLALNGLPPSLTRRMQQHPEGWWDLLRLAFREEIKDNRRAQSAWEMDMQSRLSQQLGRTTEEFEAKCAAIDAHLLAMWDDLKRWQTTVAAALSQVLEQLSTIDTTTRATLAGVEQIHGQLEELKDARSARASLPPFQLPKAALAGRFFGRTELREQLIAHLQQREDVDVWGEAGMGKTALAAEALRAVVADRAALATSPYPDGIVLLDLYRHKATAPASLWNHLADSFDESLPENPDAAARARKACVGRQALVIVEGAEEAGDGHTLQQWLEVLAPETVQVILTRDRHQLGAAAQLLIAEELSRDEALALLGTLCPAIKKPETLAAMYERLGGHPLALTWAGKQLTAGKESPRAFLAALTKDQLPALHEPRDEHHTLRWLYRRSVARVSPSARRVLTAAGLLAQQPFPLSAALATVVENDTADRETTARTALAELVRYGLLRLLGGEDDEDDEQWDCTHALVHNFAAADMRSDDRTTLLPGLGQWAQEEFARAVAHVRTGAALAVVGDVVAHATTLLQADQQAAVLDALRYHLLYDGFEQIEALGRMDFAQAASTAVHSWLTRAFERHPEDQDVERELSVSYDKLGNVEMTAGQVDAARTAYTRSLTIAERLAQADPTNAGWQRDLSVSYEKLGNVEMTAGQVDAARTAYTRSLTIRERLAQADPTNAGWQRDLFVSYTKIGNVFARQGQRTEALVRFEQARAISARLVRHDPANATWRNDLATIEGMIAGVRSNG